MLKPSYPHSLQQKVYIIILNYKTWKDSIECLESVFLLNYSNYQVVLIDNFSQDESLKKIEEWAKSYDKYESAYIPNESPAFYPSKRKLNFITLDSVKDSNTATDDSDLVIIKAKSNKGFAAGNNLGMRFALTKNDYDFIWLLNNDTIVEKNALTELVKFMNENSKIGISGSVLLSYTNKNILQGVGGYYNKISTTATEIFNGKKLDKSLFQQPHKINYPIGAALFVNKSFIKDTGLLNEKYFLFFEEMDWTLRGKKKDWDCGYAKNSLVWHKGSSTINKNNQEKTKLSDYFGLKSKLLFTYSFFPFLLPLVYLNLVFVLFNRIRRKQFDRIMPLLKIAFHFSLSNDQVLELSKK